MTERGAAPCAARAHSLRRRPEPAAVAGRRAGDHARRAQRAAAARACAACCACTRTALTTFHAALDARGRHRWGPIAPCARIEVDLQAPALRWQGHAYFDSNEGDEPIERGFTRWDWLRTAAPDGSTAVIYDVQPRDTKRGGASRLITRRFSPDGSSSEFEASPRQRLGPERVVAHRPPGARRRRRRTCCARSKTRRSTRAR